MASGAGDGYWAGQALPSVFKHALLDKYVPQFVGMTGSRTLDGQVVFLDGYAGRGRYENGEPASAERILRMAESQSALVGLNWVCFFAERDRSSAAALQAVVAEYVARGVSAEAHHGDVLQLAEPVLRAAADCPLFLFLDPCGLGPGFDELAGLLNGARSREWPPTELLLNFSLEAVRRIGGQVASPHANPSTLQRMDDTVGGRWWRQHFAQGSSDEAADAVTTGFAERLSVATGMHLVSVPVRRAPRHKPVYHLIFGTRKQHGLWAFGDAVARSTQTWWDTLAEVEAERDPGTLFSVTETMRPVLDTVEEDAAPAITRNLAALLAIHPSGFKVVDHTASVFGTYYGQVRETSVRRAVKALHAQGGTSATGVGPKTRDLVVLPTVETA